VYGHPCQFDVTIVKDSNKNTFKSAVPAVLYLLSFPCRNCRSYVVITVTQGQKTALVNMPLPFGGESYPSDAIKSYGGV